MGLGWRVDVQMLLSGEALTVDGMQCGYRYMCQCASLISKYCMCWPSATCSPQLWQQRTSPGLPLRPLKAGFAELSKSTIRQGTRVLHLSSWCDLAWTLWVNLTCPVQMFVECTMAPAIKMRPARRIHEQNLSTWLHIQMGLLGKGLLT